MAKILLVEDNEMNRDMLSRRLERKGHSISIAIDGAEGLSKARSEAPDLILMDMSLPVIDGWEATRQLEMNRDMLSRRLERKGHSISIAIDGVEGLSKARSEAPDLILMDMSLPVIDGWEATRQLKADETTRRIPIIALTEIGRAHV